MQSEEVIQLHLDDVIPNRFQPREVFDDQALKELAVSIKEHGVIQPIIVRKIGEKYEIIAGERRYKASSLVGLTTIPAIVKNLDDKQSSKVALIENLQRRDLTPIEEARTYQKILDIDDLTQEELARTMGKSQSAVANKLRLLTLPDEVQQALLKEQISERHARSLLNLNKREEQINLLNEIVEKRMPVRAVDERIKQMKESSSPNVENETMAAPAPGLQVLDAGINENINPVGNPESLTVDANNREEVLETLVPEEKIESLDVINPIDQTVVDIDKIREQATDINATAMKQMADMSSLLKAEEPEAKEEATSNRFIPDLNREIETTNDGQEIIGTGLLAGMPVIQPHSPAPENLNQTNSLGGIIQQEEASINPNVSLDNPIVKEETATLNEFTPTPDPLPIQNESINETFANDNLAPVEQVSNSGVGQDFTDNEELKFASIAITNIIKELEGKGFKVENKQENNANSLEIIIRIEK